MPQALTVAPRGALQHPSPAAAVPLSDVQAWLLSLLLFMLAATNGEPFIWSSLAPALAISGLLLIQRTPADIFAGVFGPDLRRLSWLFIALFAISLASALAAGKLEGIAEALLRSFVPLIIYFALAGVTLRAHHVRILVAGLICGMLFMLVRGIVAFYAEWGIPDVTTLLWARYKIGRAHV